jgi:hypothetical protein
MAKHPRTTSIKAAPPSVRCTTTPIIHTSLVIPSSPFNSPQRFRSRTATNARLVSAARRSFASKTAINETLRESTHRGRARRRISDWFAAHAKMPPARRYYDGLEEMHRRFTEEMNLKTSSSSINVQLDSAGGDVDAAIEIGRFLRNKDPSSSSEDVAPAEVDTNSVVGAGEGHTDVVIAFLPRYRSARCRYRASSFA